jgi:hypothetical protein
LGRGGCDFPAWADRTKSNRRACGSTALYKSVLARDPEAPVPKLCQNPIYLKCLELLFEREQVPQVVDIRHFRMELMESLERANILRNPQVAGSIPAGGSIFSIV